MVKGVVTECVVNVSEGRDPGLLADLAAAGDRYGLDIHADPDHHRSVFTLAGGDGVEAAVQALAKVVVERIDIGTHLGAHPRIGALDVVPFVALVPGAGGLVDGPLDLAVEARDRFAAWVGSTLGLPCFLYGPERTLPEVRRRAWRELAPDFGPPTPHPTAGAAAVGARPALVAYNLWLAPGSDPAPGADLARARRVAAGVRRPGLRTLGLAVGHRVQVSCNLVEPFHLGPGAAYDAVAATAEVERAELVGLLPRLALRAEPRHRWAELGLDLSATIEARLERAGLDGGSF